MRRENKRADKPVTRGEKKMTKTKKPNQSKVKTVQLTLTYKFEGSAADARLSAIASIDHAPETLPYGKWSYKVS